MRELPIINAVELEMIQTKEKYIKMGVLPLTITIRATKRTVSTVIKKRKIPEHLGKVTGDSFIRDRRKSQIDNHAKKFFLDLKHPTCLEEYIEWFNEQYPEKDGWIKKVQQFEVEIIDNDSPYKGYKLQFNKNESLKGEKFVYSLLLTNVKIPKSKRWFDEGYFSDNDLFKFSESINEDICIVDYSEKEKRKPLCR